MKTKPLIERLGLVLIGIGLVMGPIADPVQVAVIYGMAGLLLATCAAADLILAGRRRRAGKAGPISSAGY